MLGLQLIDEIYLSKTRDNFKEVLSSYSNGNYRSATVMLYSTVICDILLKLQELKDMYNDSVARAILKEVEAEKATSGSKSSWEKSLIDKVYQKTKLIDLKAYSDINHLYDDRNFSAHPAINEDFILISPSQESTIAHILNMLTEVLIKPSIFIKDVIDLLTEDLKEKKELYLNQDYFNNKELAQYLNRKYFSKMTIEMKKKTFKAFWKFCYILLENDDCKTNRTINQRAIAILLKPILNEIVQEIKDNQDAYVVALDAGCQFGLVNLFAQYPQLYGAVSQATRLQIDKYIDEDKNAKWGAWFKFNELKDHIEYLKNAPSLLLYENNVKFAIHEYKRVGQFGILLDLFINLYEESYSFQRADETYTVLIKPYLNDFTKIQIEKIIVASSINGQIYNRSRAYWANTEMVKVFKNILGNTFDYSKYPRFDFDREVLKEI